MRITFNTEYAGINDNLTRVAQRMGMFQEQLSSGRRLNQVDDDPAGAAVAVAEHGVLSAVDRYKGATDSTNARLSVVDSALNDIIAQLTAAKTAAASASGSVGAPQRQAAVDQLQGIKEALVSDLNISYRGTFLFSGTKATTAAYSITSGTVSLYQGNANTASIDVDRAFSIQATFDGQSITKGSDASDVFAEIDTLIAAIQAGDATGISAGIDAIDRAFSRTTQFQTAVGTSLARIGAQNIRLDALKQTATTRLSTVEDANIAEAATGLTAAQTAQRAALAAASTVNQLNLMDFLK